MAYLKKKYRSGQSRGGVKGVTVDSSFGAPGNKNGAKKDYHRAALTFHGGPQQLEEASKRLRLRT